VRREIQGLVASFVENLDVLEVAHTEFKDILLRRILKNILDILDPF